MRIGDICTRGVVRCERGTRIPEVAQLMRNHNVGDIVVVDPAPAAGKFRPVGVVTDRDLVLEVLAQDVEPGTLTAGEVMREDILTAGEDDSVYDAIWQMRRRNVRRLPVVDDAGNLAGLLSLDDVIGFLSQEMAQVACVITDQIRTERVHRAPVVG